MVQAKLSSIAQRFQAKMKLSQTPVPGFILGLSGTDSIVAFHLAWTALKSMGRENRLVGVHYVKRNRRQPTYFEKWSLEWLKQQYPEASFVVDEPLGGNFDQQRWADLHRRSLVDLSTGQDYPVGENFWTVGTINATEEYLGTYSILAKTTSVQPLHSLWKSEVIEACKFLGVPEQAIQGSQVPDCLCGRDELAAANIELVDAVIRHQVDPNKVNPKLLKEIVDYVRITRQANAFKTRVPYMV